MIKQIIIATVLTVFLAYGVSANMQFITSEFTDESFEKSALDAW